MRRALAATSPPGIAPDDHCFAPYECPFWDHCTKEKPDRWIYHLPGSRRTFQELSALGIETLDDIPAGYPLQLIQQRVKDNVEWIGPGLRAALGTVEYPVHHLDFETIGSAIPLYPNTRPYQAIPFQWSNHIESEDGSLQHEDYLCARTADPREELAVGPPEVRRPEGEYLHLHRLRAERSHRTRGRPPAPPTRSPPRLRPSLGSPPNHQGPLLPSGLQRLLFDQGGPPRRGPAPRLRRPGDPRGDDGLPPVPPDGLRRWRFRREDPVSAPPSSNTASATRSRWSSCGVGCFREWIPERLVEWAGTNRRYLWTGRAPVIRVALDRQTHSAQIL